jgi:hypothetical protein
MNLFVLKAEPPNLTHRQQNFQPSFYEVMNAFAQSALSTKDTCTHNNTTEARLKLRREYFYCLFLIFIASRYDEN